MALLVRADGSVVDTDTGQVVTDPMLIQMAKKGMDPMGEPAKAKLQVDPFTEGEKPIGYQDPRGASTWVQFGKTPPIYQQLAAGQKQRHKLQQQKARELGETGDVPTPATGPHRPVIPRSFSYAELMRGIPAFQGGGGTALTIQEPKIDPKLAQQYRQTLREATQKKQDIASELGEVRQAMYSDLEQQARERRVDQQALKEAHTLERQQVKSQVADQMKANKETLKEIEDFHVDPTRIYGKGAGGEIRRILAAVAVGMGAYASIMTKTPNWASQIINAAIDRDMKSQMANLATKKFKYKAGRSLIEDLYAKTQDIDKTYIMAKMAATDAAKAEVDAITRKAQSREQQLLGEQTSANLAAENVKNELSLAVLERRNVTKTIRRGGGSMTPAAAMAAKLSMMSKMGLGPSGKPLGAPGAAGVPMEESKPSVTDRNKVAGSIETLIGLKKIEKAIKRYKPIMPPVPVGEKGRVALTGKQTRAFQSIQKPVEFSFVKAMTGVAGGEKERARYSARFIQGLDPTGVWGERSQAEQMDKLRGLRQASLNQLKVLLPMYPSMVQQVLRVPGGRELLKEAGL